jgi:L,D-transpeptidase catalytic domain
MLARRRVGCPAIGRMFDNTQSAPRKRCYVEKGSSGRRSRSVRASLQCLALLFVSIAVGLLSVAPSFALPAPTCHVGAATNTVVGRPTTTVAWRAKLLGQTGFYTTIPREGVRRIGSVAPSQAAWLLVLGAGEDREGRCWVKVRLPRRPNRVAGWIDGERVRLRPTSWRIFISLAKRTLTVDRGGIATRRLRVVVGAPATPTPGGLFSIIGAWRSPPSAFLGSWILALTAHSNVLREFDGGNGRIGIHGRGGSSLRDPLGSERSHGCVRLANTAIDWLVHTIGRAQLAGTPVQVD